MATFLAEGAVKAVRRRHQCFRCTGRIEVGQPAATVRCADEGRAYTLYFHPGCRAKCPDCPNRHDCYGDCVSPAEAAQEG